MTASRKPFSERPFVQRCYQRFLDWLWFGPLTRDLRASRRWQLPVPPDWRQTR